MSKWRSVHTFVCALASAAVVIVCAATPADAANIYVSAGGDLQGALNSAQGGDTILLAAGATYTGNFTLPIHSGTFITVRSDASDALLPPADSRISPSYAPYLPKIVSPNSTASLRTAPGAAFWKIALVEIGPNATPSGDIVTLGDGSAAQYDLSQVPHDLILDRVYIHGHPLNGQKRGVALNSVQTTIVNSYIADIKTVGSDNQAIAGWNGPGPFRIENNFLEASTQMVLFGGDDPKIAGLVVSDVVVRGNTMMRPTSWRSPILATPAGVALTPDAGGTLAAGTYAYRVTARRSINGTQVKSAASVEVATSVGDAGRITIAWNAVPDAVDYLVYGRAPGAESVYWITKATSFTDDGVVTSAAGTPSSTGTVWQVKNILELKNAQHVQIDHNVMQNNWQAAQPGNVVLFTPRNQYGSCTWCVVQDVTFEYNIVRSVASGFQVLGYDNLHPSQQTNNIRIRNNEFSDLNKTAWGGNGYFAVITGGPRDLTIDHNTVISPSGGGLIQVDGPVVYGFVLTNNVARHNSYGITSSAGMGNPTISYYFPDGVVTRNVLAGGKASLYPAGNLFPTITDFQAHFVAYTDNNFALVPGTDWAQAGTDGLDLGADEAGLHPTQPTPPAQLVLTTTELPATTVGFTYSVQLAATGGVQPYKWSVVQGALPPGITLDAVAGALGGAASAPGDFPFTLQVMDQAGTTAALPLDIKVVAPVAITTTTLPNGTVAAPYSQTLQATGGSGAYSWRLSGGSLPPGVTLAIDGTVAGTPSADGVFSVQVEAADAADSSRVASAALTMTVLLPPNAPPAVTLTSPSAGAVVAIGSVLTVAATASDVDGMVQRTDVYVNGTLIGSVAGAAYTTSWTVPASGSFTFTAVATDNRGASTTSAAVTVTALPDIVIYARRAAKIVGKYSLIADTTAAGSLELANPDARKTITTPAADPATYAEFTFVAEAGRPYHVWIRGKAQKNSTLNDSAFVQFSGVAGARIGTTEALTYILEDGSAGVSGWGWQDNNSAANTLGANIVFDTTGAQSIRIQPREDGLAIDQIVISPARYLSAAPGATKNDATIVPQ